MTKDAQLQPPADPWAESAPVLPPTAALPPPVPYVVVVERRRRRWPWVLGVLAGVAALCCGGAIAVWTPISKEHPAYLELGDEVAGFSRVNDARLRPVTVALEREVRRDQPNIDQLLVEILTDHGAPEPRRVVLIAATLLILDPVAVLDEAIRASANRLKDVTYYTQLGGQLTCANSKDDDDVPVVICGWVDHGSFGLGVFYGPWTMDASATTLRDIRSEIVRRGSRPAT